ncbi:UNVERIFIED_CONTAM: hypothetical protein GTU68_038955 [Idotea baltica]|nr:hypothetical protein [Idotea baltica]
MNFLITNDDGFDGPGLAALYQALLPLGSVAVSAPAVCHSAKGHAVNTWNPIKVERREVAPFGAIDIVEASPADCVRVGLRAPEKRQPDYVIAGINTGANLGVDLFYSGTAAAAREAAILGVPSIAVSRYMRPGQEANWEAMVPHVTRVIQQLISDEHRLGAGRFWNVNFPAIEGDNHPDDICFVAQNLESHDIRFEELPAAERPSDDQNLTWYRYSGEFRNRGRGPGCDVTQCFDDKITATPIDLCTTAVHPAVRKF